MQLTYRGTHYFTTSASIEITEQEIIGKYRGTPVHIAAAVPTVSSPRSSSRLTYRGNEYIA